MKKKALIIFVFAIVICLFGVTYAFFNYYKLGGNKELIAGEVSLVFDDGEDTISLVNIFPETTEEARSRTDNQITFTVSGANTTTNKVIWYEVMLNKGESEDGKTRFLPEHLVFDLIEIDENGTETMVIDAMSFNNFNKTRIWVNTINSNNESNVTRTYKLRMWLTSDVIISDSLSTADYTTREFSNSYASVKVSVYGDFTKPTIGYVTYDLSSLSLTNFESTPIYYDMSGTITTLVPSVTGYKFLGWGTSLDGEVVYNSGDSLNASDIVNNNLTLYPIMKELDYLKNVIVDTLSLTSADSDGTRFVSGSTVNNNYITYANKIWRIVSLNSDGTVKIITQDSVTTSTWQVSGSSVNTDYSASKVYTYLNQTFLPTLYSGNYTLTSSLVSSKWNYTLSTSYSAKPALTNYVTSKVGLLTVYEVYKTGSFLRSGTWWTMTPYSTNSKVWFMSGSSFGTVTPQTSYGVRPAVVLPSTVKVLDGLGTSASPYQIGIV